LVPKSKPFAITGPGVFYRLHALACPADRVKSQKGQTLPVPSSTPVGEPLSPKLGQSKN